MSGMCNTHMHDLRGALTRKGLGPYLQAKDGNDVLYFAQLWLEGRVGPNTPHRFDPYVVAVLEIQQKRDQLLPGLTPIARARCPLCLVEKAIRPQTKQRATVPELWIDNISDLLVVTAKQNGFIS